MTANEAARQLGIDKSVVSRLVKRGMPLTTVQAAQAWRAEHAPPRCRKKPETTEQTAERIKPAAKPQTVQVIEQATPAATEQPEEEKTDLRESLKMARHVERVASKRLVDAQKNINTSPEEFRRINSAYISARQNRMKAEQDMREWRRAEGVTLTLAEAQEIFGRPHSVAAALFKTLPKQLANQLHGQPVSEIERTLAESLDRVQAEMQKAI
jgi:hypothetical protein